MKVFLLGDAAKSRNLLAGELAVPHEIVCITDRDAHEDRSPSPLEADVVVSMRFDRRDAARFRCRMLHLPGAGTDLVEFSAVPDDCWVCNVYEHEGPIAEFVLLAMLRHEIRLCEMSRSFTPESWAMAYRARRPHGELAGKTVGIIGFGRIAREISRRAKAFGMRVAAVTRTVIRTSPKETVDADWVGSTDMLPLMLARSDFVVVACPLTDETRGLIAAEELRMMKRSAVLINVARAEIVVEEDLYRALSDHIIAGAALDVWYAYPDNGTASIAPSRFAFHELENVLCTPHSSAWTEELFERRFRVIARNIERLYAGEPLKNVVRAAHRREVG